MNNQEYGILSLGYAGVMSGLAMNAPYPFNIFFSILTGISGVVGFLFFRLSRRNEFKKKEGENQP